MLSAEFCLLENDTELARGKFEVAVEAGKPASLILPTGLVTFDKEADFKMSVAVNGRAAEEVFNKKVSKQVSTS
jgi:hypothetical protein